MSTQGSNLVSTQW